MSNAGWLRRVIPRGNKLAVLLYVVFFAILLSHALWGVGQYWDWTFPYFADQIGNFFTRSALSWTEVAGGSSLGYSSDYFLRFVISLFKGVTPEVVLFVVLLATFTTGAMGVYALARRHTKPVVAFLLGVAAFVNPTIFYKFTAGHVDYLVSYVLLIYLAYFLLYRFRPTMRSAVVVAFMLAIIGIQIQFLAIAAALIALYFFFRPEQWRWRFLLMLVALPILVNMVWLSNFIFGGANVASVSGEATKASFRATSNSDYLDIFSFSFSKATLISRFYSVYELLLYGLLFVLMVVALLRTKRKQIEDVWLLTFLLVLLFLATGLFQLINLGPLTTLYPMFREVGHFAPLIVLVMIILIARLLPRGITKAMIVAWLVIVIAISFVKYQTNTQSISFAAARQMFSEFKKFGDTHGSYDARVLAYPFFDQYAFTALPIQFQDNLPLRNSGHDSFAAYSSQQFVKNAVKPQDFKASVQYRLLQSMDVDVLKPYNVHYIYDFSGIYESYYERYVPPSTYDGDISWIKNDPDFLNQLLQANPEKLRRVSAHILEVTDYSPRISAVNKLYSVDSAADGEDARTFIEKVAPHQPYDYIDRTTSSAPANTGAVTPLFANAQPGMVDVSSHSLVQTVNLAPNSQTMLFANNAPSVVTYEAHAGTVTFYATNPGKLSVGGSDIQPNDTTPRQTIGQVTMPAGHDYYIGLEGDIMPLKRDGDGVVGHLTSGSVLELFAAAAKNLVDNSSFESGLWSQAVGDCNDYDKSPDIGMRQDSSTASDGKKSLELWARHHDACTSTNFDLKGDTTYLLTYDYQSPNADTASFYLRFNNVDNGAIKRFQSIADDTWHTTSQPIVTPEKTTSGQLFMHALGSDASQPTINRYDNIRLIELQKVGETTIAVPDASYAKRPLSGTGDMKFSFTDPSYTYANAVPNGSFEKGAWQASVADCNNYDKSPRIGMNIDKAAKTDGVQSLRMEATRHAACTYTNVNVQPGTDYILSFDYQSDDPSGQLGYYAELNGGDTGYQDRINPADRKWHTFTTKIHVPALTPSLRLYLHTYEDNGSRKNSVRFDNVKLVAIPSLAQQFYVVSEPQAPLSEPKNVAFHTDNEARRTIKVSGANGPFVLALSGSYHPSWRLELDDDAARNGRPGASVRAVSAHFQSSGFGNGWYIDPGALCTNSPVGCHRNADGSYDVALVAEFVPQRWFAVNQFLSASTLLFAASYIALTHRRAMRAHDAEGVYKHPLARRGNSK